MPEDRTVLDHLLEGRDALQREVERLTAAIEQLDSVLGRIGSTVARSETPAQPASDARHAAAAVTDTIDDVARSGAPVTASVQVAPEPVNAPVGLAAPDVATVPSRSRAPRKTPAKGPRRPGAVAAEPPKSIRVHVLEMLQAERREFGLAEIIDRVHEAGIQAHDDAVRSITIKLMKDGSVERVGRGQYRLARPDSASRTSAAVASAPRVTEAAPEPAGALDAPEIDAPELDAAEPGPADPGFAEQPAFDATTQAVAPAEDSALADATPTDDAALGGDTDIAPTNDVPTGDVSQADPSTDDNSTSGDSISGSTGGDSPERPADRGTYAPSLNLGQPWNS